MRRAQCFVACLLLTTIVRAQEPSLRLTFEGAPPGETVGAAQVQPGNLTSPRYPSFAPTNKVLALDAPAFLRLSDSPERSLDFDNGDDVTFEAWVQLNEVGENVAIISKGRTAGSGPKSTNQNWAFRLRKNKGLACPNFLFRSRSSDDHRGNWHRWTANDGFGVSRRWHHVAVSYRFGEPKSIRAFLDGREVKGKWDMGGPTTQPPVVDDDDVLVGSTMNGNRGNSLDGSLDNVIVHRRIVPADELRSRYAYQPPPIKPPTLVDGTVTVELFGPVSSFKSLPEDTEQAVTIWQQGSVAFTDLPQKYDTWGVRDDWGTTMLVRAWTDIELPAGDHELLIRSRGLSELKIDGKSISSTPAQKNRSGAHHVVDDLPLVPVEGMRPAAMSDSERLVSFRSDGGSHRIRWDIIVGGPSYRLEFGETCLAIRSDDGLFRIVAHDADYPLTDEGWNAFATNNSTRIRDIDRANRQTANAELGAYWNRRHKHTKQTLLSEQGAVELDDVIQQHLDEMNAKDGQSKEAVDEAATSFFRGTIQPIFDAHCIRCHGDKQHGELLITDRERLLQGGESDQAAIHPGKPDESYLVELISADPDDYRMPPKGDGLSEAEVEAIRKWISDGAVMPSPEREKVVPPQLVDDETFLRRAYLDTVGVPPTQQEIDQFFADPKATRRNSVVDRLLYDDRWADNWVGYWQDVLAENPNLLKPTLNNTGPFRYWIHEALIDNKSVDRFATELILMRGGKWSGGAAGFSVASQNDVPMAAKAHVIGTAFLGINMKCARCHDAPYHSWKQSDLFEMAAMLRRRKLKLPASSTVPAAFFEEQERRSLIDVTLKPNSTIDAHFPFESLSGTIDKSLLTKPADTREQLAVRVTSSRRFAEVIANRVWKRLMGAGIVDPVDDWEGNPPSDPRLLSHLAEVLIGSDYDLKQLTRHIMRSKVYQRAAADLPPRRERHFAGPYRRRMSAEQIVDSAFHATGKSMDTEMLTMDVEGTLPAKTFLNFGFPKRSWEFTTLANERDRPSLAIPKAQMIVDVLKAFGWRNSRPEPLTDRDHDPNLIQPGVLANGSLGIWLTRLTDESDLTTLARQAASVEDFVDGLFWRILTRRPTAAEREQFTALLVAGFNDRLVARSDIAPVTKPKRKRYVSWSNHLNTEANVIKVQMQDGVRRGPPPTRYLKAEWRERAEDAIWALINSPEMIVIP